MRLFLNESKRDDLLLPYFELVKDKFPGLTLGKFKTMMLDKLAAQGSINNLSLGSNFYLAGATRYYFQGALTTDNKAALLTGDANTPDNWDTNACEKLNIVINILRNSFIDSIGTKYEIEEDFGKLTIEKLFRKYGKKINAELGIETEPEQKKNVPELDRNPRVGNGYTFDILYSYPEATKYRVATAPGSWCITYGENHYDGYVHRLGIHYVIFLKDGYENVPRQTGPGYTRRKPHDEYGNSMIAYLQRNDSWEPTFITSRWNHGYGDTSGTEADHAYTLEEFCNITGVTPEDLQRIYKIWKTDKSQHNRNSTVDRTEVKEAMTGALRKLKYAQMMINNGQKPEECLETAGATRREVLFGNGEQKKSVIWYTIQEKNIFFAFLCDRTNIVFDTFFQSEKVDFLLAANLWGDGETGKDIIIMDCESYSKIYSVRYHTIVDIGGKTKFKRLPSRRYRTKPRFIEVKNSFKDIALLSLSNCKPLKLPNGAYWFNAIKFADPLNSSGWRPRNEIICDVISEKASPIIEIVYDESSREKYFYSLKSGKFLDELNNLKNDSNNAVDSYSSRAIRNPADYELQIANYALENYTAAYFTPDYSRWHHTDYILLDSNGRRVSIYGQKSFKNLEPFSGRYLRMRINDERGYYYSPFMIYDTRMKKYLAIGDKAIEASEVSNSGSYDETDPRFLFVRKKGTSSNYVLIYDSTVGLFVKNPYYENFDDIDSPYSFVVEDHGDGDGKNTTIMTDKFDLWDYIRTLDNANPHSRDNYDIASEEKLKHMAKLLSINLEYVPNNYPENNEYEYAEERAVAPSVVNEEMIRNAVMNAIKKLIG